MKKTKKTDKADKAHDDLIRYELMMFGAPPREPSKQQKDKKDEVDTAVHRPKAS